MKSIVLFVGRNKGIKWRQNDYFMEDDTAVFMSGLDFTFSSDFTTRKTVTVTKGFLWHILPHDTVGRYLLTALGLLKPTGI